MKNELENLSKQALLELLSSRDSEINSLSQNNSQKDQKINSLAQEKDALSQENDSLSQENDSLLKEREYLKAQIEMYKRMQFGQKRERFEGNPDQMALPFEVSVEKAAEQEAIIEEKITYQRKRPNHKGRAKLPSHLDVEEIEIFPQEDLSEMVCIGKEITEELECQPARFYIKRYIRYKYAAKNREGVVIGELPERVIDKGIPGAGLLSMILTDKYVDHLPLYRQKQRFSRENIQIASSTIEGWTKKRSINWNRFMNSWFSIPNQMAIYRLMKVR